MWDRMAVGPVGTETFVYVGLQVPPPPYSMSILGVCVHTCAKYFPDP